MKRLLLLLSIIPFMCSCGESQKSTKYQAKIKAYITIDIQTRYGDCLIFGITNTYLSSKDIEGDVYDYYDSKAVFNCCGRVLFSCYMSAYCETTEFLQVSLYQSIY